VCDFKVFCGNLWGIAGFCLFSAFLGVVLCFPVFWVLCSFAVASFLWF